jgi:hypothetical protein
MTGSALAFAALLCLASGPALPTYDEIGALPDTRQPAAGAEVGQAADDAIRDEATGAESVAVGSRWAWTCVPEWGKYSCSTAVIVE